MYDNERVVKRNRQTCLQLEFMWPLFLGTPYMNLYYTVDNGLTQNQVFQLQIIMQMTIVVTGIPFGFLADRYGLRRAAIVASCLQFVALTGFCFCDRFWQFQLSLVGSGLYTAAQQNLTSSVMTSTLGSNGGNCYDSYEARASAMHRWGVAAGVVIGGTLTYCHATDLLYQLQPIQALAGYLLALRLIDPAFTRPRYGVAVLKQVARRMLIELPGVRAMILLNVSILSCSFISFWMYQPLLEEAGINPEYFGLVYLVNQLAVPTFSRFIGLLRGQKGRHDLLLMGWAVLLPPGLAIAVGLTASGLLIVVLMIVQVCTSVLVRVITRVFIYDNLPDEYSFRTAELSISTTLASAGYVVAGGLGSVLTKSIPVLSACIVVGVMSCVSSSAAYLAFRSYAGSRR